MLRHFCKLSPLFFFLPIFGQFILSARSSQAADQVRLRVGEKHQEISSSALSNPLLEADVIGGKSIGNTSVVFRLQLQGGASAAYKPNTKRGKNRYVGEVAAYRLATALGLANVPLAYLRRFDLQGIIRALGPSVQSNLLKQEAIVSADGKVDGAMISWIAKLEILPLEKKEWREKWGRWLAGGSIPAGEEKLAEQISVMLVFDYLTGNWDRWSGGNIGYDRATKTLLFIDNDGAFFDPVPRAPLASQRALLAKCHRFSKGLIDRLRALDRHALAEVMGHGVNGTSLLSDAVLDGVDARRGDLLQMIEAKEKLGALLPF